MKTGGLKYAMELIDKNFGVGIGKAKKYTDDLDKATNKTNADVKKLGAEGEKSMNNFGNSVKKVGGAMVALFAFDKAVDFGKQIAEVTDKTQKLQTNLGLNLGAAGAKSLEQVDKRAKDLNLSIESNRTGFASMSQAMNGTKISGKSIMDIYDGVAVASATMLLSGKDNEALLNSFGATAKKRIVDFGGFQSEFGDKIPGAFAIAAKSMGMTESKLKQMMDDGKVNADKFLPAFASQIKTTFQEGLPAAANSMQAAMNKKENALTGFWEKASQLFGPGITTLLSMGSGFIDWFGDAMVKMEPVGMAIWNIILALQPLWDSLGNVISQFGTLDSNTSTLTTILNGAAVVVEALATGFGFFIDLLAPLAPWIVGIIALQWAWNIAMAANPVGVVVLAIVALIGAIVMAYQKIGWFRGAIMAAWESIKGFAKAIKDYVINRFKDMLSGITGIGKTLMLFFKGDWEGAFEAGKKAVGDLVGVDSKKKLINDLKQTGLDAGKAYGKGMKEAEKNNIVKKKDKAVTPTLDANGKFFDQYAKNTKSDGTIIPGADAKKQKGVAGGGNDSKHITFNIHSFVDKMTINSSNALGITSDEIRREMNKIFMEIISDLEVRVNG
jgi:tape measure domain-containing protein